MGLFSKGFAFLMAVLFGLGFATYSFLHGDSSGDLSRSERLNLKKNIVVMGVDQRDDDVGRSDTLFVVMLDTKHDNVSLLSIPRDTMVKIHGHSWDKINHAYAFGGHKLTEETVEEFLGLRINNYVLIDFKGFINFIDALGGIDLNVDKRMYYTDPYDGKDGLVIDLRPGQQHLDGKKAIQYVRYRDEEGDIGRIRRQQKFMAAVYDKLLSPSVLPKLPKLVESMASMVKTDLSVKDMLQLAKAVAGSKKASGGMQMAMVPGKPADIDEINYWIPDMTELRTMMAEMQGATMTDKYRLAAQNYKSEYDKVLGVSSDKKSGKQVIKKPKSKELQSAVKAAKTDKELVRDSSKGSGDNSSSNTQAKPRQEAAQPKSSGPVRVQVLNCSGINGAGARVASMARAAGLTVTSVGTGDLIDTSQVIVSTNDDRVVAKVSGLPFRYAVRVINNPGAGADAVIYLGKDFK